MENAVVVKLTESAKLSPDAVIKATIAHAKLRDNKTLFTIGHKIAGVWRDSLEYFIATTSDGKTALLGRIVDYSSDGDNKSFNPGDEYEQPSQWDENDKITRFALSDVRKIVIKPGDLTNDRGEELFTHLFTGANSRAYVNYLED